MRYIDGCTDSLLIPPVVLGDPCLNLLHIPPGTHQTQHVHPSIRVGTILSGTGTCETPGGKIALEPGLDFVIRAGGRHSFHTAGEALRVLAWHPDSDCGPSHEDHPMLNRTWIDASGARVR
ncbi:MAG: cupin domain-containing protein [Planctomycetota bacterium]